MTRVIPEPTGAYLRELLGVDFTDDQLAIATHPLAPQLVVAGAGSGKTMVMAARVVHAVAFQGLPPGRILGLTFTNKAAGELSTRVRASLARLPQRADRTDNDEDDQPSVATYHAYAAAIVRDHALRIGREPYTTLLTEATQWQLALRVVRRAVGPFAHLNWTSPSVAVKTIALAAEMSEHLLDVDDLRTVDAKVIEAIEALPGRVLKGIAEIADAARTRDEMLTLVAAYTTAKEQLDLIDYGDQVALAARIAQSAPLVSELERRHFGLVVLDEYQDTGVAQRLLLAQLFGGGHPVTAVGDPNQAIYGWRGASVGNLLRFGGHFPRDDGQPVLPQPLMTSFRCGGRILDAANAIAGRIGTGGSRRPPLAVPELTARAGAADAGAVVVARVETDVDESDWVARQFEAELDAGTSPGAMAVLVRRRADFARLHHALVERDIPVEVVGLGGLLEMPEVADVVATLSLLVDPTANAAAIRLLTGPRWRLGIRDLAALGARAARLAVWSPGEDSAEPEVTADLRDALRQVTDAVDPVDVASLLDAIDSPGNADRYSPQAHARLAAFRAELVSLRPLVGQPLVDLVTQVVRTIGLDIEIEAETERVAVARAANLAAFVDHAAGFSGLEGESDLPAFLAYLAASADADNGLDVGAVSTADTVKLMTIHKAKGLEWDVVAVPGLVHEVFPSNRGRRPWTRAAEVVPFELRGDAVDLPTLPSYDGTALKAFEADCKADDADEERRLAYVAFTRPRRLLLASGYCWTRSRLSACRPSTYLDELRALAAPAVTVECWCDDPADDMVNPLAAIATRDVAWPATPDADRLVTRRRAADLVREAMAHHGSGQQVLDLQTNNQLTWAEETELVLDELRAERRGVVEVTLPRRLTASQVVRLAEDPAELARALARPMPVRPQPQARRGSRFHKWVEDLYGAVPLLEPDDLPGATDAEVTDDELARLQDKFLADGWGERRPVAIEQPFELVVGGRLVRGRIDAVYVAEDGAPEGGAPEGGAPGGGFDVIDYKTGAVPADFAAASLQLSVYRLAWADLAGVDPEHVNAGFLYVRTGTVKRPDRLLSREELTALFAGGG